MTRRAALLALLLVAAPALQAEPARRLPPPAAAATTQPAAQPFSRIETEAVLRAALAALAERYIRPLAVPDIAARSIGGALSLSPSLALVRQGSEWRIESGGRVLSAARAPASGDAAGWAALVAALVDVAPLRAQGQPRLSAALLTAAAAGLDPYTRYMPPAEARAAQARRRGGGGIGVRAVPAGDGAAIAEVVPDSPADHAGLAEGDRILAIDGTRLRGLSEEAIAARLAGEEDTRLVLTVRPLRSAATRQVALIRALVVPRSVFAERRGNVAVVRIATFNRLTDQHVARALLEAQGAPGPALAGVVLDLRGNRGGLLRQAVAVVDLFLVDGEIAATRGRHPDAARTYVAGGADITGTLALAVLVDGGTASAAEIVAASLQAHGRATVIGSATMGKGLVQTVVRLPDDGELVLTWSRVLVPPGRPLQDLGVVPSLCTAQAPDAAFRALEALRTGNSRSLPAPPAGPDARAACPPRDGEPVDIEIALALLGTAPAAGAAATAHTRPPVGESVSGLR
jgi:carboxyl-terminal processing protease